MGYGTYSSTARTVRAESLGYTYKSAAEIFSSNMVGEMNPKGIDIRESRDSEEHPNSLGIILGLDLTGSMGHIPHYLVKEGIVHIMDDIIAGGIKDPQVLFLGVGDHECDRAPLQVGQFESSDELLDHWLTNVYIEGGGGPNNGESYLLAWYFAGFHTSIDCFEKRGQKGLLYTIGDEPNLPELPGPVINRLMGSGQAASMSSAELLKKAQETYDVYHLHLTQGNGGRSVTTMDAWRDVLKDNFIIVDTKEEVASKIVDITVRERKHIAELISMDEMKV